MKKMRKTKRMITLFLSVCLLLSVFFTFAGCASWRAPKVEDIYDRVVELVEASYELNTVFYGAGLPVYESDSEYAEFTHMYYDFSYAGDYEIVSDSAKFLTIQDIENAAEKVYSAEYLENVLYPAAFVGYAIDDGQGDSAYAYARYMEENSGFYRSTRDENYLDGMRIYDYSTMQVVKPSRSTSCYVTMSSWLEDSPELVTTVRLRLVLQADGLWYLDSFTG